jgi:hypothetical protein
MQLTKTETLLREIMGKQPGGKRKRRGIFNFVGELSKILFGTMDDGDAKYYNDQIKLFEQGSEDMTALTKEQLSVVKSSLGAINHTLIDMAYNEDLMKEGINKVTNFMNTIKYETESKLNIFSAKVEVEGHMLRVNTAINKLQRKLNLLIDSVVNAQKGVLQPQIISPVALMDILIKSVSAFPKETTLPFPMSKDSAHLLIRLCELQVYVKDGILGYVIMLHLVNRGNFDIYRLIPIPVPLDRPKFLYIDTGKSYLWIDQGRQYYLLTDKEWVESCKMLNSRLYVCKQNQPLLSSHLHDNCMVKMLKPIGGVPSICEKRVV